MSVGSTAAGGFSATTVGTGGAPSATSVGPSTTTVGPSTTTAGPSTSVASSVATTASSGGAGGAPPGCVLELFGGHEYYLCTTPTHWGPAETDCVGWGGHLASIGSQAEDQWLFMVINQLSNEKWWVGMNDISQEGIWVWSDASAVTYTNWHPGEPNDSGNEDCMQLNRFYPQSTWNDEPCAQPLRFVCELP